MGRGRKGSGVEPRANTIRIGFQWRGKRQREPLDLPPTPANLKYAARLVEDIKRRIASGTFDYAEFFPDSKQAVDRRRVPTLLEACDLWLAAKGRLAPATLSQYGLALAFWQGKLGANTPITEITHGRLAALVGSHPWSSAKMCNNALIPLRGVFTLSLRDISSLALPGKPAPSNPLDGIENAKFQKSPPDPFTLDEAEAILADLARHYDERAVNYFEFAFFSGMRPEEMIALRWDDVSEGQVRVQRAKTFKGGIKAVKTYQVRDVELMSRAEQALTRQAKWTRMKDAEVFENPVTSKPWHDDRSQRDHYWKPALRRLQIRYRSAYQTRHTFATVALMSGANPAYIARQLGHKNAKMVFEVYAKWIDRADRGREMEKIERSIAAQTEERGRVIAPVVPPTEPSACFVGRRDWTRTNDPHHVKVML